MVINDTVSGIFSTFCHHCLQHASSTRVHFCSYATRTCTHTSILAPDSVLRYSRDGFTSSCRILRVDEEDGVSPCIFIKMKCGRTLYTSPEHLQHLHDPDVASVPSTVDDFRQQVASLSDEDLSFLANPQPLESIEIEWLQWHNSLNHLSRSGMIQLVYAGVLPKKFLRFRHLAPFCASCAFGKAHWRQWRFKPSPNHPIRSAKDILSGAQVSVDQLISAQLGLLAQMSGYLTRRRISCATMFKDHFSDFMYCHLQVSSGHEETLAAKWAFEKFSRSCNVDIRAY